MVRHLPHTTIMLRSPDGQGANNCEIDAGSRSNRNHSGFTLMETLMALLIIILISIIVAAATPSAINTYRNTVAASNAQTVLATVTTALRGELGSATAVKLNSGSTEVNSYICGEGYAASLDGTNLGKHYGPVKTVVDSRLSENGKSWALIPDKQVVSTQEDLKATFEKLEFDKSNQTFKVTGLGVYQEGKSEPLAYIEEDYFAIRSPYCEEVTKWSWEG